ncbi:sulfatase-like hydrolase/transferase [Arachidicoccus soli]|uniref:Sulfatase n=1 Tax=Arachidicoccus soli TaxID=2341117 RepID=A0A386HL12_9BACT|nr:sulfatase-like hydrolase/transferase [Arachidicoccus soli]AYD46433.1 sulfatase [Arachidicoccus soli]
MKKAIKGLILSIIVVSVSFYVAGCSGQQKGSEKEKNGSKATKTSLVKRPPNILIIFPDELRRYSAGFWSQKPYKEDVVGKPDPVFSPNIDRLAKTGVVFTSAIANYSLCSPSRGMFLSGMYPEQTGIWNNCFIGRDESLKDNVATLTDLFYQAGYNTSYFGKCHWLKPEPYFDEEGNYIGSDRFPGGHYMNSFGTYVPPGLGRHSIQYFYQAVKDNHYDPYVYSSDPHTIDGKKDGEVYRPKIWSPKLEAAKIIDYLQNKNDVRDTSKPFFMMWALNPPHPPYGYKNSDTVFEKKYYGTDKFPSLQDLVVRDNANPKVAAYAPYYFGNVTSVDYYMGLVLDELKKMGALDNTIVIFSSDHGEMLGSHDLNGKNVLYTESLAVPFIISWPDGLQPGISNIMFGSPDALPTIMGLAGLSNKIPAKVQGTNFATLLTDPSESKIQKPTAQLLMLVDSRGILTDRYTLGLQESKEKSNLIKEAFIYDNLKDPYQLNKISLKEKPDVAKELLAQLGVLLKKANDPWYKQKKHSDIIPYPSK